MEGTIENGVAERADRGFLGIEECAAHGGEELLVEMRGEAQIGARLDVEPEAVDPLLSPELIPLRGVVDGDEGECGVAVKIGVEPAALDTAFGIEVSVAADTGSLNGLGDGTFNLCPDEAGLADGDEVDGHHKE